MRQQGWGVAAAVIILAGLMESTGLAQGSLTPPGPPGPTMKTLDQIHTAVAAKGEKRTPISALPFTISQPGSYYLTQNLTMNGSGVGITVNAGGVTIDLNGFSLSGGGVGGIGIMAEEEREAVTICNGTIQAWTNCAVQGNGTHWAAEHLAVGGQLLLGGDSSVRSCHVAGIITMNSGAVADCTVRSRLEGMPGINSNGNSVIRDCIIGGLGGGTGIVLRSGSVEGVSVSSFGVGIATCAPSGPVTIQRATVEDCEVAINVGDDAVVSQCALRRSFEATSGTGILGGGNVRVIDTVSTFFGTGIELGAGAHVSGSQAAESLGHGIVVGNDSRVIDCTARGNGADGIAAGASSAISDCIVSGNGGDGIRAGDAVRIIGCTARQNGGDGIEITGGGFIAQNLCDANTGSGINATGFSGRIEGNTVLSSGSGIWLGGSGNIVIKNTLGTANPIADVGGGNRIAPIEDAATATNPCANLAH